MITLPPTEYDLHAYVDLRLNPADRQRLETWLASHPEVARELKGWQQDARLLRTVLGGAPMADNPALDPTTLRQRRRHRYQQHFARAAVLVLAVGLGGIGGWQAHQARHPAVAPMSDALQAYHLFAEKDVLPADFKVSDADTLQPWLDRYFHDATRLPDLGSAGFKAVGARLLSTDQGPAAMVLYQDAAGAKVTFYIRPPGPNNNLLPRGTRREGQLQADYWSGPGYNYAMVAPITIAPKMQNL
ncbi:anti-sigma factor family protein [Pseudomonas putida]